MHFICGYIYISISLTTHDGLKITKHIKLIHDLVFMFWLKLDLGFMFWLKFELIILTVLKFPLDPLLECSWMRELMKF